MSRRRPVILVVALASVVGATACSSGIGDVRPSPMPPGYLEALARDGGEAGTTRRDREGEEQIVDGIVAAVGDRVLTRSEVMRALRLEEGRRRRPGATENDEIDEERVRWAITQLIGIAARQAGLLPDARRVDYIVKDRMEDFLEEATEKEGRPVTEAEWLAAKRLTKEEFRRQFEDEVLAAAYVQKLMFGMGPTRPEVDAEVTPSEVRRVFRDHPEIFDEPAKVRSAVFHFHVRGLADEQHTPAEWQDLAERRAEQMAELFRQGHDADFLAKRYRLDQERMGLFQVAPQAMPLELVKRQMGGPGGIEGITEWLERPDLGARQTLIARHPEGPLVYGVLEFEPAARKSFEEAYDTIVTAIRGARQQYARARLVIQLLDTGSVVSPPELEDMVLDEAQQTLDQLAADEILGKVRLR